MNFQIMILFLLLVNQSYSLKKKDVVSLKSFHTCEGHKVPNEFFNTSTDYIGRGITVMNGDMIIKVPAKQVVGRFSLSKCATASGTSCEEIISFPVPNLCERYEETGQYYTSYLNQIQPKYKCPMIVNTHYHLRNGTFDSSALISILDKYPSYHNAYWLLRNQIFRKKDNLELNCVDFILKVERVIVRRKENIN